uniref:XPG N-terminal domain-containing protein n=1 Tax=Ascaris lumbricoides TaxID=6252 RepID=A0A9J2P6U6_ASCLU
MGIQGLWPILEPTAEPVTLESLEGKRFAIDVSLWLYQAIYGYGLYQQETRCPHLSLLLSRLSKLLFYKIRPVFVFDGPNVPLFKRKILRERQLKRFMDEITVSKAQKRVLTEVALSHNDEKHSPETWKSAFGAKRKAEEERIFEMAPLRSANDTNLKRERKDSDEPEVICSSLTSGRSTETDETPMEHLLSRDQRLDYLLSVRERERTMRLTEDQVPEDSRAFCNFQIERLLRRNRINEQLDMLKKEALGETILLDNKPEGTSGSNILLTVMEGLTRGHFLTRDDGDVLVDEESMKKEQEIKDSISWPAIVEQMKKDERMKDEAQCTTSLFDEAISGDEKQTSVSQALLDEDDEDDDLQEAIALSLRDTNLHDTIPETHYLFGNESKGDVIERLRNSFASRNRADLQRDMWSDSERSSSNSDDFIDVAEPDEAFLEASSRSASNTVPSELTEQQQQMGENWMPNYVNEFDDKKKEEASARKEAQMEAELEREQEGVYKECQELLRLCGIPFVVSPGEAEAQCCELERLGLVQGIVSDDSDVWLFGASTVYKNMFNQKRRVQMFSSETIHKQLGLTRWETVQIALLSGGDYTPGLDNIGVVTALELISEFALPSEDNCDEEAQAFAVLQRISDWLNGREESRNKEQQSTLSTDEHSSSTSKGQKRRSKEGNKFETARRLKLRAIIERNNEKEVIKAFPSREIFEAYSRPLVDKSNEKPIWGTVKEKELEEFVRQRLGWDQDRLKKRTQGSLQRWNEYLGRCVGGGGLAYQTHITSFTHRLHKSEDDQRLVPTARVVRALRRLAAAKRECPDPSVSLICKASLIDEPSDSSNMSMCFEAVETSDHETDPAIVNHGSSQVSRSKTTCRKKKKVVSNKEGREVTEQGNAVDESKPNIESTEGATRGRGARTRAVKRSAAIQNRYSKKARCGAGKPRKLNDELNLSEESSNED